MEGGWEKGEKKRGRGEGWKEGVEERGCQGGRQMTHGCDLSTVAAEAGGSQVPSQPR